MTFYISVRLSTFVDGYFLVHQSFALFYFESAPALLDVVSLGLALPCQSVAFTFGSSDLAQ